MKNFMLKIFFIVFLLIQSSKFYSQNLPIIGFGDQANYRIDYFTVPGSSGLDLHWHGGIRFSDYTGNNVMQIAGGNVGIGTSNPGSKLDVNGNLRILRPSILVDGIGENTIGGATIFTPTSLVAGYSNGYLRLSYPDNNTVRFGVDYDGNIGAGVHRDIQFGRNLTPYMTIKNIDNSGNVGIGTNTPSSKLDVNVASLSDRFQVQQGGNVRFYASGDGVVGWGISANFGLLSWDNDYAIIGGQSGKALSLRANGTDQVRITTVGNVGIGTTNPNNKLDVNGTIHSKEVKVDMIGWSDFVFKKEYTLPTLEEVEKQISKKGHLANIPSEEEVLKNGINLGEMNAKLLQKIEELTLYVIDQNKRLEKVEKENTDLRDQIGLSKKQ